MSSQCFHYHVARHLSVRAVFGRGVLPRLTNLRLGKIAGLSIGGGPTFKLASSHIRITGLDLDGYRAPDVRDRECKCVSADDAAVLAGEGEARRGQEAHATTEAYRDACGTDTCRADHGRTERV